LSFAVIIFKCHIKRVHPPRKHTPYISSIIYMIEKPEFPTQFVTSPAFSKSMMAWWFQSINIHRKFHRFNQFRDDRLSQ